MNQYLIDKLKEGRLNKGLKQSDVTKLTGIKNTTLSNYENGNTEPDMDTFLQLCRLYDLDYAEIIREAYGYKIPGEQLTIKASDINRIRKYHKLDDHGREMVDIVLAKEYDRCHPAITKTTAFPKQVLNAAHDRGATEEEKANAERIMDDDSEWE